ncbi:MAG: Rrf2 family transcriptional regulator [bacterium]|nr:Rrf2 family transcriptional regulator [bacterium]
MLYQQSTAYAIEALGYLATLAPSESIKARTLAQTLDIPEPFLAKVLSQLVRKRFVSSTKGPNGGFALAVDPGSVTLYRIMAATDSLAALEDECVMGLHSCTSAAPCAFHESWMKFKERVVEQAQSLTILDISKIVTAKLQLSNK